MSSRQWVKVPSTWNTGGSVQRKRAQVGPPRRAVEVHGGVLSALSGVPVFFLGDEVPDWVPPSVAVAIVLTIVALVLIHVGRREAPRSS